MTLPTRLFTCVSRNELNALDTLRLFSPPMYAPVMSIVIAYLFSVSASRALSWFCTAAFFAFLLFRIHTLTSFQINLFQLIYHTVYLTYSQAKEKPLKRRCVIRRFRGIFFIKIGRMERREGTFNQLRHG